MHRDRLGYPVKARVERGLADLVRRKTTGSVYRCDIGVFDLPRDGRILYRRPLDIVDLIAHLNGLAHDRLDRVGRQHHAPNPLRSISICIARVWNYFARVGIWLTYVFTDF